MKKVLIISASVIVVIIAAVLFSAKKTGNETAEITQHDFQAWSVYEGTIESTKSRDIKTDLNIPAPIIEIIPDGVYVKEGDVLVRFETSQLEPQLSKAEKDYSLAKAEYESLINAKLPMQMRELQMKHDEADIKYNDEYSAYIDSLELLKENLLSEKEVKQQEIRLIAASNNFFALKDSIDAAKNYLNPAEIEKAKGTLEPAETQLTALRKQMSNSVIKAPAEGLIALKAIYIENDFRAVRVGDIIKWDQSFICMPDLSNMIIRCEIPESDLVNIQQGAKAFVTPVAFPNMRLKGTIENIGGMAQSSYFKPGRVKYFLLTIRLSESDSNLRAGMSAKVWVLSQDKAAALQAPRTAVFWENGTPYCNVLKGRKKIRQAVKIGFGNDTHFEILEGLKNGDKVEIR